MGLLDYDLELAKQAISKFPGLLSDYAGKLNSNIRDSFGMDNARNLYAMRNIDAMAGGDLKQAKEFNQSEMVRKGIDVGLNFNPAAVGQIVWHGSPHKFSKFDMSKIGTGEGAQAYGHGLYMAEAQPVAQEYADALGKEVLLKGKPAYQAKTGTVAADLPISNGAAGHLRMNDWDLQKALKMAEDDFVETGDQWFSKVHKELSTLKPEDIQINRGQMYKVDIPDEAVARFLDWDKPLSQQAPEVQNLLTPYLDQLKSSGNPYVPANLDKTGDLLQYAKAALGVQPEQELSKIGIPGIRYLDGGSRGQQAGTSNFVLFDDQMPRILEINGQPTGLNPWEKGEWKGLLGI